MPIYIPALRERKGDVAKLADFFLRRYTALENKAQKEFSEEALSLMEPYDWPGNIRQLENMIFRLVLLVEDETIEAEHLREVMPAVVAEDERGADGKQHIVRAQKLRLLDREGELRPIRDLEEDVIYFALKFYDGRISEVARRLGIGRSTLYRKMNDFDIQFAS